MVNVSKRKWKLIKSKLPKNYRELILQKADGITLRQISLVKSGECKNPAYVAKVKDGINSILRDLGYSDERINRMW
ncbi:hypothetical protein SAMN05660461_5969 [Chitinophaga ginsengisegetis]|uniref:Uncharacterized protein n=1 Tax=Chitinophaga ginsengisegetis TaxID=393003 RepID=A0A1T5PCR6_9BACT|nr:hypothetical protein SAMN05660461_5969 [Chitinophaga ginsengisegetis]